jgi:hypothetical protein
VEWVVREGLLRPLEPLITGHLRPLRRKTAADEISA